MRLGSEKDVRQRIEDASLPPAYKKFLLRKIRHLTNYDASKIYPFDIRDTEFNEKICIPKSPGYLGGCCEVDWTAHGAYRSELRDRNPEEINRDVSKMMLDNIPEEKSRDTVRVPGKTGPIVMEYDQTRNPVQVEIITAYPKMARTILQIFKKRLINGN